MQCLLPLLLITSLSSAAGRRLVVTGAGHVIHAAEQAVSLAGQLESDTERVLRQKAEAESLRAHSTAPLSLPPVDESVRSFASSHFYVYNDVDWTRLRCDGRALEEHISLLPERHTDDFWFLKAALRHPLRTRDPRKAELFVVPALMNTLLVAAAFKGHCCIGDLCNNGLLHYMNSMLTNSSWFQRRLGRDHVLVCSFFHCNLEDLKQRFPSLYLSNQITFEENSMRGGRCRIASTYVGNRCLHTEKRFAFGLICTMTVEQSTFQSRRDICRWLDGLSASEPTLNFSRCGGGPQCPALAEARFGFHARGDTWGSQRPMDAILSGTVPMFTAEEQYEILPPFIPWRNITVQVDVTNKSSFEASLWAALPRYAATKRALDRYAHLVDWETSAPFEQYMWMFRQCSVLSRSASENPK